MTATSWGLYLAIENIDGQFLDQHELPDGNLYEMKSASGKLDNDGENRVADKSDLNAFMGSYLYGAPRHKLVANKLQPSGYYSYRSISEAIHNYDIWEGKNYYYFLKYETSHWSMFHGILMSPGPEYCRAAVRPLCYACVVTARVQSGIPESLT